MNSIDPLAPTSVVATVAKAEELASIHRGGEAQLIELRLDLDRGLIDHISRCELPVLATLRSRSQGGQSDAGASESRALLELALERGATLVDLELERDCVTSFPAERIVYSHHDPRGTPDDLEMLFERLTEPRPAIAKLACLVRSGSELTRLLALRARARELGVPTALVGMGEVGVPSRILAAKLGLALTFGMPAGAAPLAPGQLDVRTLGGVYRCLDLRSDSPVFAVVGSPVVGSGSPRFHNASLIVPDGSSPAVYIPLELPDLESLPALAESLDLRGMSVTMPHKERVAAVMAATPHDGCIEPSVNTLWRDESGWRSASTDGEGLLRSLQRAGVEVEGRRVALLGAGGAARAAVAALADAGARVVVVARRIDRARDVAALAGDLGEAASMDAVAAGAATCSMPLGAADIVINATPVGHEGWSAAGPHRVSVAPHAFGTDTVLMDMVANPIFTPWLTAGRFSGHRVVHGFAMLTHQALAQQRLWTGSSGNEMQGRRALLEWAGEGEPRLWLVGPRGAGKSTAGRVLAAELGTGFVDLDRLISRAARMPAGELLERHGEGALRELEQKMIRRVLEDRRGPVVVSTGGGAILEHGRTFARRGITAYLFADPESLALRVQSDDVLRPPLTPGLSPEEEARHILGRRDGLYRAAASTIIDTTTLSVEETVAALKHSLGWLQSIGPAGPSS